MRFNFALLVEGTEFCGIRKPCTYTSVWNTVFAVWNLLAYESPRTLEYEIFMRTEISAITVPKARNQQSLHVLSEVFFNSEDFILHMSEFVMFDFVHSLATLKGKRIWLWRSRDGPSTTACLFWVDTNYDYLCRERVPFLISFAASSKRRAMVSQSPAVRTRSKQPTHWHSNTGGWKEVNLLIMDHDLEDFFFLILKLWIQFWNLVFGFTFSVDFEHGFWRWSL